MMRNRNSLLGHVLVFESDDSVFVPTFQEVVQTFDLNLQEMLSAFIENLQALLAQAREAENDYNDKVLESAQVTLDLVLRNEAEDEIPDDLRWVCTHSLLLFLLLVLPLLLLLHFQARTEIFAYMSI